MSTALEFRGNRDDLTAEDLAGISDIMRFHIEIRNRSFMKRVHRDCFLGSDAVDFMVEHGLADSRSQAVQIGRRLAEAKIIRHVGDNSRFKDASHLYYRFLDDDKESSMLAPTNAGHGDIRLQSADLDINHQGGDTSTPDKKEENSNILSSSNSSILHSDQHGKRWGICPHTAHNSYILDIALAEELERSCAGNDISARRKTFQKVRERVREEFNEDAPNWVLSQSQEVQNSTIAVFHRKRPRGDFKNLKVKGIAGSSPQEWIKGIVRFETRKQWEPMFEDGVVVEGIDLGENINLLDSIGEDQDVQYTSNTDRNTSVSNASFGTTRYISTASIDQDATFDADQIHQSNLNDMEPSRADDLVSFLKTVELAGIPSGMSIAAVLGDSDRQKTLAHLRKQMMSSNPSECMLCKSEFHGPANIRFCPGCSMVSCSNCVSRRVFEISTRRVINVCVHCFEESSRIKHPPKDDHFEKDPMSSANKPSNKSKWWTTGELEELEGIVDKKPIDSNMEMSRVIDNGLPMFHGLDASLSMSLTGITPNAVTIDALVSAATIGSLHSPKIQAARQKSLERADNVAGTTSISGGADGQEGGEERRASRPLLSGLMYDDEGDIAINDETVVSGSRPKDQMSESLTVQSLSDHSLASSHVVDHVDERYFNSGRNEGRKTPDYPDTSEFGDGIGRAVDESDVRALGPVPASSNAKDIAKYAKRKSGSDGYARCRLCSDLISRDVISIENHERSCKGKGIIDSSGTNVPKTSEVISDASKSTGFSVLKEIRSVLGWPRASKGNKNDLEKNVEDYTVQSPSAATHKVFDSMKPPVLEKRFSFHNAGETMHGNGGQDLSESPTRIIYRTARAHRSALFNFRPREVCALQDTFIDKDGSCFVYEVSVRHNAITGSPGYVTADVLMHAFCAKPFLDDHGSPIEGASKIAIISQVDTRAKGPGQFFLSIVQGADGSDTIGIPRREDVEMELKSNGSLTNILSIKTSEKKKKQLRKKKYIDEMGRNFEKHDNSLGDSFDYDDDDDFDDEEDDEGEEDGDNVDDKSVSLDDFELLAVLGRGGFGKVMQVRHRPSQSVFAMKILKKSELVRRRQVERTQTERTILAAVRHPFIVCLHYAFQNRQKLYMVMDFVQGGDFFTLMRKFKRLPENWVKIYVGEIALALQHLHDMDVVYRDLKPENILLCGDGHLKLTDFGLSRYFETRPPNPEDMLGDDSTDVVTRSFCGTEQYMSPEMLLQQGHNFRMDWWCLGLLMHEMLTARHPFSGPSHYDTLRNMVTKQPNIDNRVSSGAASVIRSFLIKNPRARMCCQRGCGELKNLSYFADLDWDALMKKQIPMAHIPELSGDTDLSSFETTFTKEAPVDSLATDASGAATGGKEIQIDGSKSEKKGFLSYLGIHSKKSKEKLAVAAAADNFKDFGFVNKDIAESQLGDLPLADDGEELPADSTAGNRNDTPINISFKKSAPIRKTSTTTSITPAPHSGR